VPETSGDATLYANLTKRDLQNLNALMESGNVGSIVHLDDGSVAHKQQNGTVQVEVTGEVTLEFDMSDYAPDYDEP
jgi:hypothetical protein